MPSRVTSVLDVLENFAVPQGDLHIESMSGLELQALGDRVREFTAAHSASVDDSKHPVYIGGWPSANFAYIGGDLTLSTLLYSGQVVVRDPIADWFSAEQYQNEHLMIASPGYLNWGQGNWEERNARTRQFLSATLPALERFRPLIESGILVLVPSESIILEQKSAIDELHRVLSSALLGDIAAYTERFVPDDIATESTSRGMFIMPSGPAQIEQRRQALERGILYFAREYAVASKAGATYTAPFDHELYLCQQGLSQTMGPASSVTQALLQSKMPVFHGLDPKLIRSIHDDDAFGDFRSELHRTYSGFPIGASEAESALYLRDQEQALIEPTLQRARRSATSGLFGRLGIAMTKGSFGILTGLAADTILSTGGLATAVGAVKAAADELPEAIRTPGTRRIWTALVRHERQVHTEVQRASSVTATGVTHAGWPEDSEATMSINVTAGTLLLPMDPLSPPAAANAGGQYFGGPYRPCRCGSGQKFRFCCSPLGRPT